MNKNLLSDFQTAGFLEKKAVNDETIFHITTPCHFIIQENIVLSLKKNYMADEEIGGILWAKPTTIRNENNFLIDKVSYIRNAIEDKGRNEDNNKSSAYLPDSKQLQQVLNNIFSCGCLPVRFHTHPIKGSSFLSSFTYENLMSETSEQDRKVSAKPLAVGSQKLLMPDALIVGSDISSTHIFIGVYNGFIAPQEFEKSKQQVQEQNFKNIVDSISKIQLSNLQKTGLALGAAMVLYAIVKHSKISIPLIITLGATLPILLTTTQTQKNPSYFNKLSFGSADIYIPKTV